MTVLLRCFQLQDAVRAHGNKESRHLHVLLVLGQQKENDIPCICSTEYCQPHRVINSAVSCFSLLLTVENNTVRSNNTCLTGINNPTKQVIISNVNVLIKKISATTCTAKINNGPNELKVVGDSR